jgi:hypothetical protein
MMANYLALHLITPSMIILMFQSELAQVPFITDNDGKLLGIASDYSKYDNIDVSV